MPPVIHTNLLKHAFVYEKEFYKRQVKCALLFDINSESSLSKYLVSYQLI